MKESVKCPRCGNTWVSLIYSKASCKFGHEWNPNTGKELNPNYDCCEITFIPKQKERWYPEGSKKYDSIMKNISCN